MKNKKSRIVFLLIILTVLPSFGQEVLLDETPDTSNQKESWGPNRDNYIQFITYRGQFLPIGIGMLNTETIQNQSAGIQLQYKRKIDNLFSGLIELTYNSDQFGLNCDNPSQINGATNYFKEQLRMYSAGINTLFRININKRRGNHLGKYMEFGLFAEYLIASNHIGYIEGIDETDKFNRVKITESGLTYTKPLQYGFLIRIGADKYGFFYKNRQTQWINDRIINGYLPSHQLGISYSFTD